MIAKTIGKSTAARAKTESGPEQLFFHAGTERMFKREMKLLYYSCIDAVGYEAVIGERFGFPAVPPAENDGRNSFSPARLQGVVDVGGSAGSGYAEKQVAGLHFSLYLAREDFIETVIISYGGDDGTVHRKSLGRKRVPVLGQSAYEFGGKVLSVGRGTAVTGYVQASAVFIGAYHDFGDSIESFHLVGIFQKIPFGFYRSFYPFFKILGKTHVSFLS
jgi:hypothetical protein